MIQHFPEGVALGESFVNRDKERTSLVNRIRANKHSVLMAPRRYGKTSLVMKVAEEMKLPYCSVDLLAAYNAEYVRDQIVNKVSRLAIEILPSMQKAKEVLVSIFKKMKPEITIGVFGQKLSLSLSNSPLQDITDVLLKLDETAKHFKKKAVIFIDEFQQISQLENYDSIEASIRHAVERSENITYVFSGSNRQLLKQMFGDQGRPLYRLCQTITVERMEKSVYTPYLKKLAQKKWGKVLSEEILEQIFNHTELHPYYMNVLCQLLWEHDRPLSIDMVNETWHDYVKTQRQIIGHDLLGLSPNQRKIISALAKQPIKEIQSSDFTSSIKISASSAQQTVKVLVKKDMVYKQSDDTYHVLDPAVRYYLDVILWAVG